MKAKDTITFQTLDQYSIEDSIGKKVRLDALLTDFIHQEKMIQAKVTFQAGYDTGFAEGRQKGLKEVVDWLDIPKDVKGAVLTLSQKDWQAKLKEWGLE